ncbi:Ragulator complex protein LAMTOR4 [Nymphon striatum]|nr:Ragulator complex protein LAMTOR4 [Nymphon striatum]KAG1677990.1 Ragulator complex protein LAMTOR4 [Nymphon striatum]
MAMPANSINTINNSRIWIINVKMNEISNNTLLSFRFDDKGNNILFEQSSKTPMSMFLNKVFIAFAIDTHYFSTSNKRKSALFFYFASVIYVIVGFKTCDFQRKRITVHIAMAPSVLEKIPDQVGYLVMNQDGAVISSGGELENEEKTASVIFQLIKTADKPFLLQQNSSETFKRMSYVPLALIGYVKKMKKQSEPKEPDKLLGSIK